MNVAPAPTVMFPSLVTVPVSSDLAVSDEPVRTGALIVERPRRASTRRYRPRSASISPVFVTSAGRR